jgi:hypothetical protein
MPRPDFFLVGALKSGTSAMASYLGQHPDIYLPVKEVCFFGSDLEFRRTLQRSGDWFQPAEDRYLSFFDAAPAGARVGEATAYYLFSALAAREIESFSPGASIIVMLRNPVDMIHSMHKHWLFSLNEDVTDLSEALALEEERRRGRCIPDSVFWPQGLQYRSIPRYAEQLERYFDVFGRERVHVILFDDFRSDARDAYRRTLEFLGADPEFEPAFEAKNPSKQVRSRRLQQLFLDPPDWIQAVARPVLENPRLRKRIAGLARKLNTQVARSPEMTPELRADLTAYFRPEVERLSRLLQRDLSSWTR